MKHHYIRQLKYNPPWEYIPDVISFMRKHPYDKRRVFFWKWLRNALYVNWQVC